MAVQVYRCSHCGREVLVRIVAPMTEAEVSRRRDEEMRPAATGPVGPNSWSDRLRDYIWLGLSDLGEMVPRDEVPEHCPACHRPTLEIARVVE
jgi:DNA-directed RNA polymerase subunit RPC12/RpoP